MNSTSEPQITVPNYRVLGVRVSAITPVEWLSVVTESVRSGKRFTLVSQNLHSVFLNRRSPELRQVQAKATVVRIDGLPLVWVAGLLGLPVSKNHRAGFMDLLHPLLKDASTNQWRVFHLGGKPGVGEQASHELMKIYPDLQFGYRHGFFPLKATNELEDVIAEINNFQPDVLLVGMGMPRQEKFLHDYAHRINAKVFLTCGAAFDYIAGEQKMAPRWLSRHGGEWLFRLIVDPKRLWRRYLVEPLFLVPALFTDIKERVLDKKSFKWQAR